jgi:outer membrane protein
MKGLFISFSLFLVFVAKAQTPWDLQQCIVYALNHNLTLKQSGLTNQINKNNTDQSKAQILPSLNAGATHNYNFGQTIDRFTNTFANTQVLSQNFYLSSSIVLWSGLSQYNTVKANEYNYLSGVESLKQQQNDLSLNVANAYIGVIFSEEILKISENQYKITQEQLDRTSKLVDAGSVAKSVEFDIKAQLANEEVNVTTADNNYRLSLLTLKQIMNLDSVTNFSIARPQMDVQESQLASNSISLVYETGLKTQPIIKQGEYAILSAEKNLSANRGRVSPSLTFNASLGTGTSGLAKDVKVLGTRDVPIGFTSNGDVVFAPQAVVETPKTPFADQFKNNSNQTLGFTLNIPLFNGLQTHTAVKNAKLNALNARFAQDINKQNLYKNIAQAYANANAALRKYTATKLSVEAASESFKYAQQKLNVGVISAIDFNTAKNRLFAAESNLLQAKYDYIFKLKVLDYYQGKPLGF